METERLFLRKFKPEDSGDLFDYLSDEQVVCYEPYEVMDKKQCIEEAYSRSDNPAFIAVVEKESGKVIGNVYFEQTGPDYADTYEIGFVFNRDFQGKGYATEAVQKVMDDAFSKRAHRIVAYCNVNNIPSWKLLERIGMRREGERKQNMFFLRDEAGNPLWFDSYMYAVLKSEWY